MVFWEGREGCVVGVLRFFLLVEDMVVARCGLLWLAVSGSGKGVSGSEYIKGWHNL